MFGVSFFWTIVKDFLYFLLGYYIVRGGIVAIDWLVMRRLNKLRKRNLMVVFGSGGHTTEMLLLLKDHDFTKYNRLVFVRSDNDYNSETRLYNFLDEHKIQVNFAKIDWIRIPRSRKVKQSYISSVFTTVYSIVVTYFKLLLKPRMDVTIVNGPGVCVPVVYSILFNKLLLINFGSKVIYVESFSRVQKLSLSGKLLYYLVDRFVVQWPELAKKFPRARYYGHLM